MGTSSTGDPLFFFKHQPERSGPSMVALSGPVVRMMNFNKDRVLHSWSVR